MQYDMLVISSQVAASVLEKPWEEEKGTFFLCFFDLIKIYLLISPFPFPTSQELLLTVIFLKSGGTPIFPLFRGNQFC